MLPHPDAAPATPHLAAGAARPAAAQGAELLRSRLALLHQLLLREVQGRYRGSWLGLGWTLLTPLLMLGVYTFVFGVVLQARWPQVPGVSDLGILGFALKLFAGLIVFNLVSEVIGRAPTLITANPNYVKKVLFPLELLPLAALGAALFHALVSFGVLLAVLGMLGLWHWQALLLPLLLAPLLLALAGLAWLLAALGVFVRDTPQFMGMVTTMMLFLSPVFYPLSSLPPALQPWLLLNPITLPVESVRAALIWGTPLPWSALGWYCLVAAAVAVLGWAFFARTRPGFADGV